MRLRKKSDIPPKTRHFSSGTTENRSLLFKTASHFTSEFHAFIKNYPFFATQNKVLQKSEIGEKVFPFGNLGVKPSISPKIFFLSISYHIPHRFSIKKTDTPPCEIPAFFVFLSLFHCKGHTVCTLVFCGIHFMCAHLNGFQCAIIFCTVMMSALFHCTFNTFVTLFHPAFPPEFEPPLHRFFAPQRQKFSRFRIGIQEAFTADAL